MIIKTRAIDASKQLTGVKLIIPKFANQKTNMPEKAAPIVLEKRYPLSSKQEKNLEVKGKKVTPKIRRAKYHLMI